MPFLRNALYVAAFAHEVTRQPMTRMLLGEPVVMYRALGGEAVALSDICPHRKAPLHLGKLHDDSIACPYHGLRFDRSGQCVHNPNFKHPAPALKSRAYPAVERDDMIWLWMGEVADANPAQILPFAAVVASEQSASVNGYLHIKASEPLISDNLLDLSHAEFLHPFLANPGMNSRLEQSVEKDGDRVLSLYAIKTEPLTPVFQQLWDREPVTHADMYFDMRWDPPSCLLLEIEAVHVGGERGTGVIAWASHLLTPETEQSTHYFWAFARNSRLADAAFDTHLRAGISQAFVAEDAPIIEWQQRYLSLPGQEPLRHQSLPSDAGGARARAVIRRRLESQLSE